MAQLKDTIINGDLQVSNDVGINGELRILGGIHSKNEDHNISIEGNLMVKEGLSVNETATINGTLSLTANEQSNADLSLGSYTSNKVEYRNLIIDSDRVTTSRLKLTCTNGGDDGEEGNPALVIGNSTAEQIIIDTNEIHAKNNGEASILYLNMDSKNNGDKVGCQCNQLIVGHKNVTSTNSILDVHGGLIVKDGAHDGYYPVKIYKDGNGVIYIA